MKQERFAHALIRRSDGKYLTLRCSEWPERPDRSLKPDLPGGNIERGESFSEGVAREVAEETGITIPASDFTNVFEKIFEFPDEHRIVERHLFYANTDQSEVVLSFEHDKFWWVSGKELIAMEWRPFNRRAIDSLIQSGLVS